MKIPGAKIIASPSPADRSLIWNREFKPAAKPTTAAGWAAGRDPEELASLADMVDSRTPRGELDELDAALVVAFDQADKDGNLDLMQRLADALDNVRALNVDAVAAPARP